MFVRSLTPLLLLLLTISSAHAATQPPAAPPAPAPPDQQTAATALLETAGVHGGLVVHSGCGNGSLTAALRQSPAFQIHGLEADPALVEQARTTIQAAGLYGEVSVIHHEGPQLPYVDNMVNLLDRKSVV